MSKALRPEHEWLLDQWPEWVLSTQAERYTKRRKSSAAEVKRFYEQFHPVVDSVVAELNSNTLESLDEQQLKLLYLCMSWIEVASAVELFGDSDARHSMPGYRFSISTMNRPAEPPTFWDSAP